MSTVMPNAFYFAKSLGMDRNTEPFWVKQSGIRVGWITYGGNPGSGATTNPHYRSGIKIQEPTIFGF